MNQQVWYLEGGRGGRVGEARVGTSRPLSRSSLLRRHAFFSCLLRQVKQLPQRRGLPAACFALPRPFPLLLAGLLPVCRQRGVKVLPKHWQSACSSTTESYCAACHLTPHIPGPHHPLHLLVRNQSVPSHGHHQACLPA